MTSQSSKKIVVYTDGACRGNPGPSSLGVWIETLDKEYGEYIGKTTNNDAEYQAIIFALKKLKTLLGKSKLKTVEVHIRMDSELACRQLNGQYKIKDPTVQKNFIAVWNLRVEFGSVTFEHVRREKNTKADALANQALDAQSTKQTLF